MAWHKLGDKGFTSANSDPRLWRINKHHQVITMKTASRHEAYWSLYNVNIQFHQWQKGWHHENSQFSGKQLKPAEYNPLDQVFWPELNPGNCMASSQVFLDIKRICWQFLGSQGRDMRLSVSMLQYIPWKCTWFGCVCYLWLLYHQGLLIRQVYFTGTTAILRSPWCQWSNREGCGQNQPVLNHIINSKVQTMCITIGMHFI